MNSNIGFFVLILSLSSLSLASNKPLLTCQTQNGSSVLVNVVDKVAFVAEVAHGALGTQATQRSGTVIGAGALGYEEIQISDATGVIVSVGTETNSSGLDGFYVDADGKKSGINCSL